MGDSGMTLDILYYVSKIWNRIPYALIWISWKLIWDYTGRNKDILDRDDFASEYTKDIMTSF